MCILASTHLVSMINGRSLFLPHHLYVHLSRFELNYEKVNFHIFKRSPIALVAIYPITSTEYSVLIHICAIFDDPLIYRTYFKVFDDCSHMQGAEMYCDIIII